MIKSLFLTLLFCFSCFFARAGWEFAVKQSLEEGVNTHLYLKYIALSNRSKRFIADIRFRPKGSHRDFLRKEEMLSTSKDKIFLIAFFLEPGEYDVDIDIRDLDLGNHVHLSTDEVFNVIDHSSDLSGKKESRLEIALSDIYLSYVDDPGMAFSEPLISIGIQPDKEILYYYLKLKPLRNYEVLSVRAYLFIEKGSERKEKGLVQNYESLYQTNRVLYLNSDEKISFSAPLNLVDLEPGEYLLSIEIYDDATRLARENTTFIIGGDIKQRILDSENLDNSIRMMEYVLPVEILDTLLSYPDTDVKRDAFLKAWEDLYGVDAEEQMESYFNKIFTANERFKENQEGWRTDRGKIYIKYGEPEEEIIEIRGKENLRWRYAQWSLAFLFEKRNQAYILVE